jgi:hypothetical protein
VVAGALLLAVGSAVLAARELRVQVDTVSMFRTGLPHLERWFEFAQRYPLMAEPLVVVIDAPEGRAENAAGELALAMRGEGDVFERAYAPGAEPFFHRHGLLYRSADELAELGDRLAEAQPLLAQLDRDPTLPGLFELLGRALEWPDRVPAAQLQQLLAGIEDEVDAATRPQAAGSALADQLFGSASEEPSTRALILALPRSGRDGANPALPAMRRIDQLAEQLGLTRDGGYRVRGSGPIRGQQ